MGLKALRFALKISDEIYGVFVCTTGGEDEVRRSWETHVTVPAKATGRKAPQLVVLPSPYRQVFSPMLSFIDQIEKAHPRRQIAVLIPNLVEGRWYHYFLHNQRALLLQGMLRLRSDHKVIVISVPWYL